MIVESCSKAKACFASAFQLILVSEIKKWLRLVYVNFQTVGTIQYSTKTLEIA